MRAPPSRAGHARARACTTAGTQAQNRARTQNRAVLTHRMARGPILTRRYFAQVSSRCRRHLGLTGHLVPTRAGDWRRQPFHRRETRQCENDKQCAQAAFGSLPEARHGGHPRAVHRRRSVCRVTRDSLWAEHPPAPPPPTRRERSAQHAQHSLPPPLFQGLAAGKSTRQPLSLAAGRAPPSRRVLPTPCLWNLALE